MMFYMNCFQHVRGMCDITRTCIRLVNCYLSVMGTQDEAGGP